MAFADAHDIEFPLLSDSDGSVSEADGVLRPELLGHEPISKWALFLLDSDGTVSYRWVGDDPEAVPDLVPLHESPRDLVAE